MKNLLTIALPVYKRTDFVKSALDSCAAQTVPCRVLLIDNNSPHNDFKNILYSYNSPLFTYHRNPETVPQDENFNNCFRYAETPWVTILHDDDMLHCQFSELAAQIIDKYGDKHGGFAVRSYVGEHEWEGIYDKTELDSVNIKKIKEPFFYFSHLTPFPGVMVKRDTALRIGGFTNKLFPIADFDFWYRYSREEQLFMVEKQLAYYRISSTQSTVQAFYDMINNIYTYRKDIIKKGNYNNLITKLALEYARKTNIQYFKRTYAAFDPEGNIPQDSWQKNAVRILNLPFVTGIIRRYMDCISYEKA